jgi:formiminotetrahydrofolate cyclodeaminase
MLIDTTARDLLDRFASSDPTPGGGSAAALVGALGASLLAMVAGMTKTRTGAADERTALDAARAEILRHRDALIALIDRDAEAYDMVVAAFRRPKTTDEDKAARTAAIQEAMTVAAETPLETVRVCAETMTAARPVQQFGNPSAVSDIAVGMTLLATGMQGGTLNVAVNLDGLKDPEQRKSLAQGVLAQMRTVHDRAGGESHAGPASDLWRGLMKHAGIPEPPSMQHQAGIMAVEALRRLGTADARQALEVLSRSSDDQLASRAKDALENLGGSA